MFRLDEEYGEKSVSVALDGQEAELIFIDHPSNEMSVWKETLERNWISIHQGN